MKTKPKPKLPRTPSALPPTCAIVRSDAAWKEDLQLAGLGWTITHLDRTQTGSSPAPSVRSPLSAEGLALREAVLQCKRMEITKVCCESDYLQLIQAVNSVAPQSGFYSIVADIHACLSAFEFITFRWIFRLSNVVSDSIAKTALADAVVVMALT